MGAIKKLRIKDLPEDANLQTIKVQLPEEVYAASSLPLYNIENKPVYLMGYIMGDFFVKVDLDSDQVYPMSWGLGPPEGIEEWEVVD